MTARWDGRTAIERFWSNVDKSGDCWLWTGYIKPNGYASFYPGGGRHVAKIYIHRFAYEMAYGPLVESLEVDHLCNVRHCVNPAHLEAVTKRENLDRRNDFNGWRRMPPPGYRKPPKTHCKHGHEFNELNTYMHAGYRYCRTCRRRNSQKRAA